jgi:succinate dehydrogenase / fumarate reductase iron-sulfur subunit
MKFTIYRYDPDKDERPYLKDYEVALEPTDRMLLDALVRIKMQDDSLAFRRSCREGVCGSDAININGRNGLACITKITDLPGHVTLRPLPGMPVIRDLIVDMTQFFKQYHSIQPYVVNHEAPPERERLQSPREREELNGLYECILCACCSTSCPSFWWNPDKFVGPAGLPLHRRHARPGDERAARQPRGSVPAVPLPYHHELRRRLPQGPQSHPGDWQDQGNHGEAGRLMDRVARDRLKWKCRRGLLELDLVLERYLARNPGDAELSALLDLPDNDLWDIVSGRSERYDARFRNIVAQLRAS